MLVHVVLIEMDPWTCRRSRRTLPSLVDAVGDHVSEHHGRVAAGRRMRRTPRGLVDVVGDGVAEHHGLVAAGGRMWCTLPALVVDRIG